MTVAAVVWTPRAYGKPVSLAASRAMSFPERESNILPAQLHGHLDP